MRERLGDAEESRTAPGITLPDVRMDGISLLLVPMPRWSGQHTGCASLEVI